MEDLTNDLKKGQMDYTMMANSYFIFDDNMFLIKSTLVILLVPA